MPTCTCSQQERQGSVMCFVSLPDATLWAVFAPCRCGRVEMSPIWHPAYGYLDSETALIATESGFKED